jgi:hypothetical protein
LRVSAAGTHPSLPTGVAARGRRADGSLAVAQEGRDVDLVVGDLERRALAIVDARAAIARRGQPALAQAARPAVMEARGDYGDADLVLEAVVDDRAEDDVRVRVGGAGDDLRRRLARRRSRG